MAAHRKGHRRTSGSSTRPRSLAKLTRPVLHDAYARERLFGVLDAARTFPVVWIAGPPGAGKTTVAASWLEARRAPGLWYQLDSGDSDPATFFYYLKQAAETAGVPRNAPLPLFTAAYHHDLTGFARRWFRELFSRLGPGTVLALDNYQEVGGDSVLHRALAAAFEEVPHGTQVLVMSWVEPPPECSRLITQERLTRLDPEALRLTAGEAEAIAAGKDALTADQVRELHARCAGWAAGFTLLRERTRRTGLVNRVNEHATMQQVFDYFVALVFRDLTAESQDVLRKTAVLPRFTAAMAIELSGNDTAAALLESLYRRHLFVERRYGTEITYEYHALFRAFLRHEAARCYTPGAMAELSCRAAALLERSGSPDDALQLLLDAGDHPRAAALLEEVAPRLVAAGRGATYRSWLSKLPEPEIAARPLLSYWLGTALMAVSSLDSRAAYERANAGFLRDQDRTGQALAIAGLLQTFLHQWDDDLAPIQRWLAMVEPLFVADPGFPSSALAARAYATLLGVMLWIAPSHPMLPSCVSRLETLLAEALDDEVKVTAAGQLAQHYAAAGWIRHAQRVIAATEALARSPSVSPLARTYWLIRTYVCECATGEFRSARAKLEQALEIAVQGNRGPGGLIAVHLLAHLELDTGHSHAVPALIEQLPAHFPAYISRSAAQKHGDASLHFLRGKYAAVTGDLAAAVRHLEPACSLMQMVHFRFNHVLTLVAVLVERGEFDRARQLLAGMGPPYPADRFPLQAFRYEALDAIVAAAEGNLQRLPALAEKLRQLEELGVEIPLWDEPIAARQLAELLLRNDVEAEYVRSWIRRCNLQPSSPDVPSWPWLVRVRTLGEFAIEVDGIALTFNGKAPRKPLELLQAIAAFGGTDVRRETLCNALWPDSDGDTADAALRMTLSRLRKLLGHDAVVQHQGRISLDPSVCWMDVWSMRRACEEITAGQRDGATARLLDLYRGPFLQKERDEPWILTARDRYRRQFTAALATTEKALVRDGRTEEALIARRAAEQRDSSNLPMRAG